MGRRLAWKAVYCNPEHADKVDLLLAIAIESAQQTWNWLDAALDRHFGITRRG